MAFSVCLMELLIVRPQNTHPHGVTHIIVFALCRIRVTFYFCVLYFLRCCH